MRPLAILVLLALTACQPPVIIDQPVEASPQVGPEQVVVEEPEPVPMPEPGHVWMLDKDDNLLGDYACGDWEGAYSA